MSECLFCKIASGDIPSDVVYQDESVIAFRDINPVSPVHVLIIPKVHVASMDDVNDAAVFSKLMSCAVKLAKDFELERGYRVVLNTGDMGGQTVPHLHLHLLGGRYFAWPPG